MNASLAHLPMSFIVVTDIPARNIAIAAPLQREWRPISAGEKPSSSWTIINTANWSLVIMKLHNKSWMDPSFRRIVFTVESSEEPDIFKILLIIEAQILTGQSVGWFMKNEQTVRRTTLSFPMQNFSRSYHLYFTQCAKCMPATAAALSACKFLPQTSHMPAARFWNEYVFQIEVKIKKLVVKSEICAPLLWCVTII